MTSEVLRFCREQGFFAPGDTVTCAVSGGPDSMALLCCLLSLREELGVSVRAAHFHHGLRGAEADGDEAFVRAFCAAREIPLDVGRGDAAAAAAERKLTLEEAARDLRYEFLLSCPGTIATAHTAGDNAETVLLNLTRGAGLRGLAGIPPRRGRIVRPLLCMTRPEILSYLNAEAVPFRLDGTNDTDFCRRNRLRRQVLPRLREENPALDRTVLGESLRLRDEEDYLSREAAACFSRLSREGGLDREGLRALHPALRRRVLRLLLAPCGADDAFHTESLMALLEQSRGRRSLPGGRSAVLRYGVLSIPVTASGRLAPRVLPVPGRLSLPEAGLTLEISLRGADSPADFSANASTYRLNYAMIGDVITVRSRETGDVLSLPGGRKTLKRLMIDRKIPAERRAFLPVLASGGQVLAVYGLGVSAPFLPRTGNPVLVIEFTEKRSQSS